MLTEKNEIMSLIAAAAIGAGGMLGSGAMGAFSQGAQNRKDRQWQEHMQKAQWQAQEYFMDKQNKMNRENAKLEWDLYSSPIAQRRAMEAAGINPFAPEGSSIQPGPTSVSGVDQGSSAGVPAGNQPAPLSHLQPAFVEATNALMDAKMKEAQIKKVNAETLGVQLSNRAKENENSLFDLVAADKYEQYLSNHFNRKRLEYEDTIKELRFQMEQGENMAVILDKLSNVVDNLASAAKTDADRLWVDKVNQSIVDLNEANAGAADASARLSGALADTEDDLREGRVTERNILNRLQTANADAAEFENVLKALNLDDPKSLPAVFSRIFRGKSNSTLLDASRQSLLTQAVERRMASLGTPVKAWFDPVSGNFRFEYLDK